MNKKIITILLIISILSTGLTALAAQDNDISTASSSGATENTEQLDNSNTATQAADNESANNTNESENDTNITENQTNRTEINKLYEMIKNLDDKQYNQLLGLIKDMKQNDFDEFNKYLNTNNITEEGLIDALNKLDDDEYCTLYIMLYNINSNSESSINDNQISKLPQRTQKAVERTSNDQLKQAVSNYNNHNNANNGHQEYKLTLADKYIILNDLIEGYIAQEISFDKFKEVVDALGFDTSSLVLNSDGTISWDGLTIPSPLTQKQDNSQNSTTNTTDNATNASANDTTSDNTQSQDTQQPSSGNVENTDNQQQAAESSSSSSSN